MSDTSDDYLFEDQQQPFVTDRRYWSPRSVVMLVNDRSGC